MPFKLNKTPSRVPDLPMHSGYSLCLVCGLTLEEKASLNDCDYLHSGAAVLTTLEDVLTVLVTLTSRKSGNLSVKMKWLRQKRLRRDKMPDPLSIIRTGSQ